MITPDDKDWTWVLERRCEECGFDGSAVAAPDVAGLLRANAQAWSHLFDDGLIVAGRTDPTRWSNLEYACHVRDVFQRFDARMDLMLTEDDPAFPNWDQDATAVDDRYDEQDPARVVEDLLIAADRIAARLDGISGAQWDRPGRRSNGSVFTLDTLSRYLAHDPIHHLWDVEHAGRS
ncbi:DinB family protein [Aquihabitans sp. McL0605]|uniref:DinB family protein n=1 Tax=Aquihabitans sp. McL0605 TaxID=3415671 RepID=UPI003CF2290F